MNWDQLGAIGELVSGIAVLATLLYLAVQIRQAKHLMLSNAHQTRTDRNILLTRFMANDEQSLKRSIGQLELDELSELEKQRAVYAFSMTMRHFEDMHYQRQLGVVDEETWDANLRGAKQLVSTDTGAELWAMSRHMFRASFALVIDELRGPMT